MRKNMNCYINTDLIWTFPRLQNENYKIWFSVLSIFEYFQFLFGTTFLKHLHFSLNNPQLK